MQEKKVYLLTEEQMQSFTDKLCQLSKELNVPAQEKKVTILGNELADAAIRILDLAGTTGDDIGEGFEDVCKRAKEADNFLEDEFYRRERFTESIYMIVDDIITAGCDIALFDLFLLADVMGFDLMEHIRLKMEYNKTRERLHGKRY